MGVEDARVLLQRVVLQSGDLEWSGVEWVEERMVGWLVGWLVAGCAVCVALRCVEVSVCRSEL